MVHPILNNRKALFIYILVWLVIAILEFGFGYYYYYLPFKILVVDVLIEQSFLALMFLGLWYPLRFFNPNFQKIPTLILNHVIIVLLILIIWVPGTRILIQYFFHPPLSYFDTISPLKFILALFSYLVYVLFIYLFNYYQKVLDNQESEKKLIKNLKEAELTLLRSQLNPHFLFNSLNSISSLTILDPSKAHEMIVKLSDFLRYTVSNNQSQKVSLEKELQMCKAYLEIEKIRFGDKFSVQFDIDEDALAVEIPSLLLQPLFENALKHGVHNSLDKEEIYMNASIKNQMLSIVLKNGFDKKEVHKLGTKSGLKNGKERLRLLYRSNASMDVEIFESTFIVKILIPSS